MEFKLDLCPPQQIQLLYSELVLKLNSWSLTSHRRIHKSSAVIPSIVFNFPSMD